MISPSNVAARLTSTRSPRSCRCIVKAAATGAAHVVITGGNTGIGLASAKALSRMGYAVTIACRDEGKMRAAADTIRRWSPGSQVDVVACDLADLRSVRDCAQRLMDGGRRIDVLLNNAGVMASPKLSTKDGHEWQFGINHLGHFLLTTQLLPSLKGHATQTRIINLSSEAHKFGDFDFTDMKLDRQYSPWPAYGRSKLANLLFTYELARRISPADKLTVNAVHPGVVRTELGRYMVEGGWYMKPAVALAQLFFKTPEQGAATSVFLASSPEVESVTSKYYVDCAPRASAPRSYNSKMAATLWDVSMELVGA